MNAAFDWAKKPLSPELLEGRGQKGLANLPNLNTRETLATVDISEEEAASALSRDSAAYAEAERQGYVIYNRGKDLYERA